MFAFAIKSSDKKIGVLVRHKKNTPSKVLHVLSEDFFFCGGWTISISTIYPHVINIFINILQKMY